MSYSIAKYGVGFGDVDSSYTVDDVKAGVGAIAKYYNLIRTYDDFHSPEKYAALMTACEANNIDVLLGIPNVDLTNFDASTYVTAHAFKADGVTPWPNLKCIIVGNETYNGSNYTNFAPLLEGCVSSLISEIKSTTSIKDLIAVSLDFGPALHEAQNVSQCDFTGASGNLDAKYMVNAMTAIMNSGLSTPKMVFGNLYPFYAPNSAVDLNTPALMINQYAGTSSGWYPYTASLEALKKHGLSSLVLNCGETGWATNGYNGNTQQTSVSRLNMYLSAYKDYIEKPTTYSNVNAFSGMCTVFFEMFDEPMKTNLPWEPYWGSYNAIVPGSGVAPAIKPGVVIPFAASTVTKKTEHMV